MAPTEWDPCSTGAFILLACLTLSFLSLFSLLPLFLACACSSHLSFSRLTLALLPSFFPISLSLSHAGSSSSFFPIFLSLSHAGSSPIFLLLSLAQLLFSSLLSLSLLQFITCFSCHPAKQHNLNKQRTNGPHDERRVEESQMEEAITDGSFPHQARFQQCSNGLTPLAG